MLQPAQAHERVPELALTNYTLAEDGSAITYAKDIVSEDRLRKPRWAGDVVARA